MRCSPDLHAVAQRYATRAGLSQVDVRVLAEEANASASVRDGRPVITLNASMAGHLDSRRLDAVIAHEVAHLALGHPRQTARSVKMMALAATAGMLAAVTGAVISGSLTMMAGTVMFMSLLPPAVYLAGMALRRRQERHADRLTVTLLDDPSDYVQLLELMHSFGHDDHRGLRARLVSHPPLPARLAAARAACER